MMILIEEYLKTVKYFDNGNFTIIDRLSMEISDTNNNNFPLWDCEILVADASATIKILGNERHFLAEGYDNLYYISPKNQVQWIPKYDIFYQAAQTIIDVVRDTARQYGYVTKDNDSTFRDSMLKAITIALKAYTGRQQYIRIPILLDIDLCKTPTGFNYNRIPRFYDVNKNGFQTIIDAMSKIIKNHLQLNTTETSLPIYIINGLLSKIDLK